MAGERPDLRIGAARDDAPALRPVREKMRQRAEGGPRGAGAAKAAL